MIIIVAGIVTDTDMLQAVTDLLGWRQPGVRVTMQVPDEKGQLAQVATAVADAGGIAAKQSLPAVVDAEDLVAGIGPPLAPCVAGGVDD